MLETQKYLRAHGLDGLREQFHVSGKRHPQFPRLVFLKYSQIDSPMGERVVQECRGLILDEADDWRIVSYPFSKFFNSHESDAAKIDWTTARVYEKLDGSLMTAYWYAGAWRVASNGLPDAGGLVYGHRGTFADLFWETWQALGYAMPADRGRCYMFELMTPWNRVIVPHAKSRLVLIGCRRLADAREVAPEDAAAPGWEVVRSFSMSSLDDIIAASKALRPLECEGYVVRDAAFNRVKVKSPAYVALAHLKDGMNGRRLLEILRSNEESEFIGYFPEWRPAYEQARAAFDAFCGELEGEYERLKGIASQKDFAAAALSSRCSAALFARRSGKAQSVKQFFNGASLQVLERALPLDLTNLLPCAATGAGAPVD